MNNQETFLDIIIFNQGSTIIHTIANQLEPERLQAQIFGRPIEGYSSVCYSFCSTLCYIYEEDILADHEPIKLSDCKVCNDKIHTYYYEIDVECLL